MNINRREYSPERGWWLGYNPEGPSDKTVTVMRFDPLSGKPIAVFVNYRILGEEAVRVAGAIHTTGRARIRGKQQVVTCPGRKLETGPLPRKEYKWEDSEPVSIRLALLMINDIALAGVSGEVMTMIHQRLRNESPFSRTIMVTNANGSNGYIPDDAAFDQVSYEITASRLKQGCAESAIVNGFLKLMEQLTTSPGL